MQHMDLPTALVHITSLLLALACGWAALIGLLASWQPTVRWARVLTPRMLRGVVFGAVSGGLALSPAHAVGNLDGLPLPLRGATSNAHVHVVAEGESLWSIAADDAGQTATPTDIALASGAWYENNREEIGEDPNLIHPGQALEPPAGAAQ